MRLCRTSIVVNMNVYTIHNLRESQREHPPDSVAVVTLMLMHGFLEALQFGTDPFPNSSLLQAKVQSYKANFVLHN